MEGSSTNKTHPQKGYRNTLVNILQSTRFNRFVMILIILGLAPLLVESIQAEKKEYWEFEILNFLSFTVFVIEYISRIVVAKQIKVYNRRLYKTRWSYLFSFYGAIDLLSILPFILPNFINIVHASAHELIAFARFILIFKLIRYSTSFGMVIQAVKAVRTELITVFSAATLVVMIAAVLMFYTEHNAQPDKFRSIGDGMWWAVITFATVGYGDIYPITTLGKMIASLVSMLGIAMIALPSGIIGSSFRQVMASHHEEELLQSSHNNHEKLLDKLDTLEKKLDALNRKIEEKNS